MNYDRGNKKWQSLFLVEHKRKLKKLKKRMSKIDKPELSDQKKEDLDMILFKSKKQKKIISVEYFEDGFIKEYTGIIEKIDKVQKIIIINNEKYRLILEVCNIVDLIEE